VLTIIVPLTERYDEKINEFVVHTSATLELEHSLVSLSKWESFFKKRFLSEEPKTAEETFWYIKAMTLTPGVPEEVFNCLTKEHVAEIDAYIGAKMTATTFPEQQDGGGREKITAELIYYWMITLNVPFECQHWHLDRLLTLIKVCNLKNAPAKKRSKAEMMAERQRLNAERRARFGSNG
jgi:hypothetical protein